MFLIPIQSPLSNDEASIDVAEQSWVKEMYDFMLLRLCVCRYVWVMMCLYMYMYVCMYVRACVCICNFDYYVCVFVCVSALSLGK